MKDNEMFLLYNLYWRSHKIFVRTEFRNIKNLINNISSALK